MNGSIDDDIYKSTYRLLLTHAKDEYDELSGIWRDLERKAQANIAIAGVFIAGTSVAFRVIETPDIMSKGLLIASIALLATAALISIFVLEVIEVQIIEEASNVSEASKVIFEKDCNHAAQEKLREFVTLRIEAWVSASKDVSLANAKKAHHLANAQAFLRAAVITTSLLLGYAAWTS